MNKLKQYTITGTQVCEFTATVNAETLEEAEEMLIADQYGGLTAIKFIDDFDYDAIEIESIDVGDCIDE